MHLSRRLVRQSTLMKDLILIAATHILYMNVNDKIKVLCARLSRRNRFLIYHYYLKNTMPIVSPLLLLLLSLHDAHFMMLTCKQLPT